ncbi:hypothetical protein JG688_00006156 [Phytophthora aleatoria]|uniref:PX domain-containing protein n=1 Tax=Phytophthora aleatoria TaxID=2496075 RepID=A0A8J5MH80_9STRA|nr:hypothetical protein JG688_00006156 [Phytophthora aleatoria]
MSLVYLPESAWSLRYGPDYFTVAIVKYLVKEDEYALYELQIQNGRRNWKVLRRFSEFDALQARDLNPDFLARRKELLQVFLHHLLQIPGIADDDHVREFLGLKLSTELYV